MFINDKYEVKEILGKGGNGIVYKVKERGGGRLLAVKETLLNEYDNKSKTENEAKILRMCFHPSIPVIIESFWKDCSHYIVMEYVEGMTLKEYVIKKGKLSVEDTLKYAGMLGNVLGYLHTRSKPVIYGDLKPQNIMITVDDSIRLIDFGSAVVGDCSRDNIANGCYASVSYAAPEQKKGQMDERSDVYGLGALIHYMLTGEDPEMPPYKRRNLKECDIALPDGLCKVVNKSLRDIPEQRYQTVKGMVDDLQRFTGKGKRSKFLSQLKNGIGAFFFLGFAGFGYQAFEYWQWGVKPDNNPPLITAMLFLLLFALWRGLSLRNDDRKNSYRMEKNIWKTDKQGIGLFLVLFAVGIWGMGIGVQAKEIRDVLPVVLYDEAGHKVLWQEAGINILKGSFRGEIPAECFEVGAEYTITLTLENKRSKKIQVKQLEVKTVKSSIEN